MTTPANTATEFVRHLVIFKFNEDFSEEDQHAWAQKVEDLQGQIPGLLRIEVGFDVLGSPRSGTASVFADFTDLEAVKTYTTHPLHLPIIEISSANADLITSVDYYVREQS